MTAIAKVDWNTFQMVFMKDNSVVFVIEDDDYFYSYASRGNFIVYNEYKKADDEVENARLAKNAMFIGRYYEDNKVVVKVEDIHITGFYTRSHLKRLEEAVQMEMLELEEFSEKALGEFAVGERVKIKADGIYAQIITIMEESGPNLRLGLLTEDGKKIEVDQDEIINAEMPLTPMHEKKAYPNNHDVPASILRQLGNNQVPTTGAPPNIDDSSKVPPHLERYFEIIMEQERAMKKLKETLIDQVARRTKDDPGIANPVGPDLMDTGA